MLFLCVPPSSQGSGFQIKESGRIMAGRDPRYSLASLPCAGGKMEVRWGKLLGSEAKQICSEPGQSVKPPGYFPALAASLCCLCLQVDYANLESGSLLVSKVFKSSIRELWVLHCLASLSNSWDPEACSIEQTCSSSNFFCMAWDQKPNASSNNSKTLGIWNVIIVLFTACQIAFYLTTYLRSFWAKGILLLSQSLRVKSSVVLW